MKIAFALVLQPQAVKGGFSQFLFSHSIFIRRRLQDEQIKQQALQVTDE